MTLGTAGGAGRADSGYFHQPNDVLVAPNGEIYVAEGHSSSEGSIARIRKFSKDGKLIATWGQFGKGPDDLDQPHALAMDSRGRLFVGDRGNNRIKIFDQNGKLLDTWYQFSRPSGIYIDRQDRIYVADSESRIGRPGQQGLEARHSHRQREGRQGDGLHPRPGRESTEHERSGGRCGGRGRQHLRSGSRASRVEEVRREEIVHRNSRLWPTEQRRAHDVHVQGQRQVHDGRCRARHAAALGAARRAGPQGHEVRLRHRPVRRVHRAPQRRRRPRSCSSPISTRRGRRGHDDRRAVARRLASRAARVGGARRAAVRLLPGRPDHVGGGAARARLRSRPTRRSTRR